MGGTATLAGHAAGCLAPSSAELGGALSLLPGASNRICVCKCVRAFNLASSDWTPALLCRPCLRIQPTHQHTQMNTDTHSLSLSPSPSLSFTHSLTQDKNALRLLKIELEKCAIHWPAVEASIAEV